MLPLIYNDNGLFVSVFLWFLILIVFLLFLIVFIKCCKCVFLTHRALNVTVYRPVAKFYRQYQEFMYIEPLPEDIV
nr:envelope protein [Wencheng Sm shrew coronavirus]ASF90476.1 envelope protein [Wencheng Sm shrew coronavirus]